MYRSNDYQYIRNFRLDQAKLLGQNWGMNNDAEHPGTGAANLRLFSGGDMVFSSTGKWLHPLFELEEFLQTAALEPASLRLEDKIVGKAAAILMFRMGFRTVHGATMSLLAKEFFDRHGVHYTFDSLVERIDCRTEALLADEDDVERAYMLIAERAKK